MIVDGICVQFFGCFDHGIDTKRHLDTPTQQINGVGRVELDEEYYRELSSSQVLSESTIKEEKTPVEPIVGRKTRQQTAKLKERRETVTSSNKPKTRSRATSESLVEKNRTSTSTSSPPPLPMPNPLSHSSVSTARPRIHSPSHMPYPLRSPRTRQHRTSPVQYSVSSTIKNPGKLKKSISYDFFHKRYTRHLYLKERIYESYMRKLLAEIVMQPLPMK